MEPIQLRPLTKRLSIRFDGQRVNLPMVLRDQIRAYWSDKTRANPHLRNGEVFTVVNLHEDSRTIHIELEQTDYAHYLYSADHKGLGEYSVKVIHPTALVRIGRVVVFGSMGKHTSRPGAIQCCGGGLDFKAIDNDGVVQTDITMRAELAEELGIDVDDSSLVKVFKAKYLKTGGVAGKMTVVYDVELSESVDEFHRGYKRFVRKLRDRHELPEFDHLFELQLEPQLVNEFIKQYSGRLNEYMAPLLIVESRFRPTS